MPARCRSLQEPRVKDLYDSRADVIKALAHPTRLYLVDVLSAGERCVCELTELVGADISTVSKHLLLLKKAGLVQSRKEGLQVYYTLRAPCILNFFQCVEAIEDLDRKAASKHQGALRVIK